MNTDETPGNHRPRTHVAGNVAISRVAHTVTTHLHDNVLPEHDDLSRTVLDTARVGGELRPRYAASKLLRNDVRQLWSGDKWAGYLKLEMYRCIQNFDIHARHCVIELNECRMHLL